MGSTDVAKLSTHCCQNCLPETFWSLSGFHFFCSFGDPSKLSLTQTHTHRFLARKLQLCCPPNQSARFCLQALYLPFAPAVLDLFLCFWCRCPPSLSLPVLNFVVHSRLSPSHRVPSLLPVISVSLRMSAGLFSDLPGIKAVCFVSVWARQRSLLPFFSCSWSLADIPASISSSSGSCLTFHQISFL